MCNDKKKREKSIGDNPLSKNLAYLFRHPDSGHPIPHSIPGFHTELEKINLEVLRLYPECKKGQVSARYLINVIADRKESSFKSIVRLCEAYKSLYGIEINPYDLFIDRSKWLNIAHFSTEQQEICRNVKYISKQSILEGILAFSQSEIQDLDKANLDKRKYSDDPFYFPTDGD